MAPAGGGEIHLVEDGELLATFACPAGRSDASLYLALVDAGQQLVAGDGVVIFEPKRNITIQHYGARAYETSANPDFQVTNATRQAREMEIRFQRLEALERSAQVRDRASIRAMESREDFVPDEVEDRIESVPDAPTPEVPTIEPDVKKK